MFWNAMSPHNYTPTGTRESILSHVQSNKQHSLFQESNSRHLDLFSLETTTATAHLRDDVETNIATYLGLNDTLPRSTATNSASDPFTDTSTGAFSDASVAVSGQLSTQSDDRTSWSSANSILDPELKSSTPSTTTQGQFANCWEEAIIKCERLQFVLYGLRSSNGPIPLQSRHEPLRPLIDKFVKLECQSRAPKHPPSSLALTWTISPDPPTYAVRKLLPPQRTCDMLLDAYLATFESVLRILHAPTFLHDYRRFWRSPPSTCPADQEEPFLCKLVICIALGAFVCSEVDAANETSSEQQHDGSSLREQAKAWIAYGRQWLARKIMAGSRADFNTAQIVCLLALSRYTGPVSVASTGSLWSPGDHDLTRVAIQMGLHRDPTTVDPDMPASEVEIRRRLWATMLELSLQLCLDHGLPAPISPESYDCAPPSDCIEEDTSTTDADSASTSSFTSYFLDYSVTRTNPLVILARTQRLRLQILHVVHSPGAAKGFEDTHQLAAELKALYSTELQRLLSLQKKPTDFQIKLLDTFTLPFVLAPHAKFAAYSTTNPAYYFSRKVRMEVSALLLAKHSLGRTINLSPASQLEEVIAGADGIQVLASNPTASAISPASNALAILRIHSQGHFATLQWHAILALCLDMVSELEESFFPAVNGASWRQLQETIQAYVTVLEQRVRTSGGSTSAREFLFCSCAEAYIGAMLGGDREVDQAIGSAGYAALTLCCEVLEQGLNKRRGVA
ncbi:hypothetical protein GGI35DRAFT_488523 [Trichoderma velutinum]